MPLFLERAVLCRHFSKVLYCAIFQVRAFLCRFFTINLCCTFHERVILCRFFMKRLCCAAFLRQGYTVPLFHYRVTVPLFTKRLSDSRFFLKGKHYNYCAAFLNKGLYQREPPVQKANPSHVFWFPFFSLSTGVEENSCENSVSNMITVNFQKSYVFSPQAE